MKIHGACQHSADWFIICLYTLSIEQKGEKINNKSFILSPLIQNPAIYKFSAIVVMYKDQLSYRSCHPATVARHSPAVQTSRGVRSSLPPSQASRRSPASGPERRAAPSPPLTCPRT